MQYPTQSAREALGMDAGQAAVLARRGVELTTIKDPDWVVSRVGSGPRSC
jgi:hypothetical protein